MLNSIYLRSGIWGSRIRSQQEPLLTREPARRPPVIALLLATLLVVIAGCSDPQSGVEVDGQSSQALATSLGDGWYGTNLGASEAEGGTSSLLNGVFTVSGGGGDFWGFQDDGQFVYRDVTGDFDFVTRVSSFSGATTGPWSKAAVFFKEATVGFEPTAGAAGVYQSLNVATEDYWYVRDSGGYISSYSATDINASGQGDWLRMTRIGNTFRTYHWDGAGWVQHGGDRVVALNPNGYLGMGVTSSVSGSLMTATFEDVSLTGPAPDTTPPVISSVAVAPAGTSATITWTTDEPASGTVEFGTTSGYGSTISQSGNSSSHSITINGLTENTVYHFTISSEDASSNPTATGDDTFDSGTLPLTALPAGWSSLDLGGSVALGGSATHTAGVFTVTGGGPDLWGYQDDAHLVYHPVTGDFELIAQIDGYAGDTSYAYAKGALVFKENLGSGVPIAQGGGVYQSLNYSSEDYWYVRGGTSIVSYESAVLNTTGGGALLRLTRTGDIFRSYHWNASTSAWVQHGSDRTVSLATDGFVGLAATSGNSTGLLSVQFSNVSILGGTGEPDVDPPLVTNVVVNAGDTSATVTWTTDEPATTVVDFGATAAYGTVVQNPALVTSHVATLTGLSPLTTYHFQISSADAETNLAVDGDATFTTTADPPPGLSISNVVVSNITEHTATLSWTTNVPATSVVDYDLNVWPKNASDLTLKTNHSLELERMMSGDPHDFVISADDTMGQVTSAPADTLTTVAYVSDSLPPGWSGVDIGPVSSTLPGSASFDPDASGGTFVVRGTGTDVFNGQDSFQFVHYPVVGDFVFTLRVDGYHGYLHEWTKAMTMFRVDLDDDSQMFNQSINNRGNDWLYYRDPKGALHTEITNSQINPGDGATVWARLTRVGNTFYEEFSTDGTTWQFHGPSQGTVVNLPASGYVGFGVCSKSNSYLSEILYSNVTVVNNTTPDTTPPVITNVAVNPVGDAATVTWTTNEPASSIVDFGSTASYGTTVDIDELVTSHSVFITGLTPNTTYHFAVSSADTFDNATSGSDGTFDSGDVVINAWPSAWSSIDLGNSGVLGGDATYDAGVFTVSGSGGDLWGSQDDGHFVYQPVDGDFELIVEVDGYAGDISYAYAKAAVMFKEYAGGSVPSATAQGVYQSLNYSSEDYWYSRGPFGIDSYNSAVLNTTGGSAILAFTRTGNIFRSFTWSGSAWVQHGGDRVLALNSAGYVGFAATSGTSSGVLSVDFSGVSLTTGSAAPDTTAPVISNLTVSPEGTTAVVSWTTDEASTSVVDFGLDANYGAQAVTPGLATSHQVVLNGLSENTIYHFSVLSEDGSSNASVSNDDAFDAGTVVVTTLPAGWLGLDLVPSNVGDSFFDNNEFVLSGLGGDFWGSSDSGHMVYQHVVGDFDLQATVVDYTGDFSATYCKAMLLFKEESGTSGQPLSGAAGVFQSVNYGAEDYWYQRDTTGGSISSYSSSSLNSTGGSVRLSLTRTGNVFRSFRWDTGSSQWVQIGGDRTVTLGSTGFIGMGVTSTTSSPLTVTFADVTLAATPAP